MRRAGLALAQLPIENGGFIDDGTVGGTTPLTDSDIPF